MPDTLQSLEIEVKHRASGAADEIDKVSESIGRLANSLKKVSRAGAIVRSASLSSARGIHAMSGAAKKAKKPLNDLISSFRRIAFYRFIRTIIKEITQAFQEGLEWAYLFSSGITTEGSRFAKALDSMKTASTTMKAQLGSAFIGLLAAITPVVNQIIGLVTRLANALSQIFAIFTGGTYLKAADVPQKWADAATGAGKAAKEWKNQLLGFDEINRLEGPGSGGGGGSSGVDPSTMFKDTPIDGIFAKIKEKLDALKNSLDFTALGEAWAHLKESVQGLSDTISGALGWAWDNVLVPLAHWTIEEAAPRVVEALAAAFDFLNAVLVKLAPVLEPLWENVLKPLGKWLGELVLTGLDELIDLLHKLTDLVNGNISWDEFVKGLDDVQVALLAIGGLAVANAVGRFVLNVSKIPAIIAAQIPLARAKMYGLAKTIEIGALAVVDAFLIAYDVSKLKGAHDAYNDAMNAHTHETETALSNYAKLYEDKGKEVADQWALMVYNIDTSNMELEQAQAAIAAKVESYWDGVPQNMWDGFKQGWDYYFVSGEGGGIIGLAKDAFGGLVEWVKNFLGIHSPSTVFKEIGENMVLGLNNGFNTEWDTFFANVKSWWGSFTRWWDGLKLKTIQGQIRLGTTVNESGFSHYSGTFASGGFPDAGTAFIAGESGPEFVGTIGGRTGVVNSDQLASSVSEGNVGVMNTIVAMANMLATTINNKDFDVELDGRSVARGLYPYQQAVASQYGASLVNGG